MNCCVDPDKRIFYNNCGHCHHNILIRIFDFKNHLQRMTYEGWLDRT